jgi:uncharacterized protein
MWHEILVAIALVLVIEGMLPFLNPEGMRRAMLVVSQMSDSTLRFAGLTSMLLGVILLYVIN